MPPWNRERSSVFAVNLGLGANCLLAGLKLFYGIAGHSPALLSDGINSTSDTVYYIVVRIFMWLARKPADHEHPYGHRQMESIAALVVGAFVITTAVAIFWAAVNKVYDLYVGAADSGGASFAALVVALATVALKAVLLAVTRKIGRRTDNPAVMALAHDHRNDLFAAAAVSLGIFLGRAGHPWVDPMAGAAVALVILHTGVQILRASARDLMDAVPGRELKMQVMQILEPIPGIEAIEEIQAHRFGPYLVINITIGIEGSLTVQNGDEIALDAEDELYRGIALLKRVYIHYHPAQGSGVKKA